MKETKKYLVYYNEDQELIGYREHHFDWEEGDVITTDGVRTTIFGIFRETDKNMDLMFYVLKFLRSFLPKSKKGKIKMEDFPPVDGWEEDTVWDIIKESKGEWMINGKSIWKDFDAQLDFIDRVFNEMD